MAFRDKVRGPLGWILGAVGGLVLLGGSFFAGMATADTAVDQEQASVSEQQEDRQGLNNDAQDQEQDSDTKPDKGMRDGDHKMRGDDKEARDEGRGPDDGTDNGTEDGAEKGAENGTEDGTAEDAPERGRGDRHHDGRHSDGPEKDGPEKDGQNTQDDPTA